MKVVVNVSLKNGVLDPQGKATEHALKSLGFSGVSDVRIAKRIVLNLDETDANKAREKAEKMASELLANPVIEDYEISIC